MFPTEVEELGNEPEIEHIERIMREGTGADRQLMVWERTQDMKAVVDQIVAETNEDWPLGLSISSPVMSSESRRSHPSRRLPVGCAMDSSTTLGNARRVLSRFRSVSAPHRE